MTQGMEGELSLGVVVKRFVDSERALSQVRERLQAIAESAESSQASASSLRESAEAIQGFAAVARGVVDELVAVSSQARAVLERGASILDGSTLRAVEESVGKIQASLEELTSMTASELARIREEHASATSAIELRLDAIDQRVQALETLDGKLGGISDAIARVYRVLPGRWKKGEQS